MFRQKMLDVHVLATANNVGSVSKLLNAIIELFKYMSHSKLFTCKLATECGQELGEIKYF